MWKISSIFWFYFFPELKHHKVTTPWCSCLQLTGEERRYRHIFISLFYKKVTNIFLTSQEAPGLEYVLVKCRHRNSLIVQKPFFFPSKLGVDVETVWWVELQKGSGPQGGIQLLQFQKEKYPQGEEGDGDTQHCGGALAVKVVTLSDPCDSFVRHFYFLHCMYIDKNKPGQLDELANVL